MCGIAGFFSPDGCPEPGVILKKMCDLIRHRGPDDEGFHVDGGCGIGMDRLAMVLTGRDTIRDVILFPALRERN